MQAAFKGPEISIHALLAESDLGILGRRLWYRISIHALLAESDAALSGGTLSDVDFYPRSPCGERLELAFLAINPITFLSTLSLRRATLIDLVDSPIAKISIHALLAESDAPRRGTATCRRDFYPRSPCGERPVPRRGAGHVLAISIHALLAESDITTATHTTATTKFLSTLSLRRATNVACGDWHELRDFYPRSPCGERQWMLTL